jgi:glycosyltransferase involved in cell wall biosynthesis
MNVLLVPNSYLPQLGGLEIAVSSIAKELAKAGHRVTVIAGNSYSRYSKEVGTLGITIYRIPFFLPRIVTVAGYKRMVQAIHKSFLSPFIAPKSFSIFLRVLKSINPDIVNLHYIGENAAFCLLAKKFLNFRFVVNIHGNDIDRHSERAILPQWLTKRTLLIADRVLSNSFHILKKAEKIAPAIRAKSTVVGNGVYLEEFDLALKYLWPKRYILSIANFIYKKGLDILIQAFHMLHEKYPDVDLLIAGDGPEFNKCINFAKKLGLSDSIKFLGKVGRSKIPSLLRGAEVFVLPSRKEPFGIVILEAMAARKPVVATKIGGIPEVIKHMKNGILVESENPDALRQGIELLLNDFELANFLAKNAYNHITENFTWDRVIQKYLMEYEQLLI